MSTGHDSGLPDHSGGYDPYGQQNGRREDPYGVGRAETDPYASDLRPTDPYASDLRPSDSYASAPYATDPYATSSLGPHPVGPPQFGAFQAPLPSSGAAITGFVLGLVGLVMCAGLTSPFGIFFSARGMAETAPTSREPRGGRGLAIAGLVTSLVGLIPLLFLLIYVAAMIVGIVMAITA